MSLTKVNWNMQNIDFPSNTIATLKNTGDIKLISTNIRDKLINLKEFKENSEYASGIGTKLTLEMTNYASRYFGSYNLFERALNQPKLLEYLSEEKSQIQIILALEAAQERKTEAEGESLKRLKIILNDINELRRSIIEEL